MEGEGTVRPFIAVDTKRLFLIWFRVGGYFCRVFRPGADPAPVWKGRAARRDDGRYRFMVKMETIEIDKIDALDRRFCISYPLADERLLASIARFGILGPLVLRGGRRPVVITGHKRLDAALRLGIGKVPCIFSDADDRQALLTSINDNLARPLNTVEKAVCVEKMAGLGFPLDEIYAVMAMLGLPAREKALNTCMAAASAEEQVLAFIVRHGLPLSVVAQLFWFESGERKEIIRLVGPLHPTVSSLREALHLMMLLKVKRGEIALAGLEDTQDMDGLRRALKKRTNPLMTGLEEKLAGILAACALPPYVKVRVDPAFERESVDITIQAASSQEVEGALSKLGSIAREGRFGSIFELTHGTPDSI